ncbi:cysteinyl-tRNA synthetase [Candidatus Blochmanniella floridana]|uniref:Cysteine--tRNA ligase n=1 Tax=Blochmanniella floridana TaxID=203907 RepID=SYC_BLOFL|nr:RecName: Full=Cysteine--tRNA ligase; AltName: Full=Cysteinyl-tRNA synthetase; Short=CysRS [Candidatus Blochmannia floridanus]CAD83375.1 cysteinyl-tRNA synthetase [Candidatus Blochmannia floridanus]
MLKIFNTLTKKKEIFKSIKCGEIKIYVCGITVYDLCHLGHARTFVIFDTILRYLKHYGYQVKYVRNITDIDDKIIQRAIKNNETTDHLASRMIQEMYLDLDILNILRPNYEPKVTDHIELIINFIRLLIERNHAYVTSDGNVMFSIQTVYNYGVLSCHKKNQTFTQRNIRNKMIKKDPVDFVLWKTAKSGEPYWISPWGKGRPGWHIECSAISHAFLGKHIDIHGGGSDLVFPHHENEIAQSTCAHHITVDSYVNTWIHTGMLTFNDEKMSKSLNNFFTIREIIQKYDPETIRYFLLSAHYRKPLRYSDNNIKNARLSLKHLYSALHGINFNPIVQLYDNNSEKYFISKFNNKMNNDFNFPEAYSILFEMAHALNIAKIKDHVRAKSLAAHLKYLANILGILYQDPEIYLGYNTCIKNNKQSLTVEKIRELIYMRENARKNKEWQLSDKIRKRLTEIGIILEDKPTGKTIWRYN